MIHGRATVDPAANKVKISKSQLRQIIKEELGALLEDTGLEEGWGHGDQAYQQATHLLGKYASLHGLRNQVADALRQGRISPRDVQDAVRGASSSYHVAQRLGLGE